MKNYYKNAKSLYEFKEEEIAVRLDGVTKDYGKGRGIFDIDLIIPKGKVFGYCGTNGAGKTTTLRHIMGFLKPDKGTITVNGLDAWKDAAQIKSFIGYLPGEIAFPPLESGSEFIKLQAEMIHCNDMSKAEHIINLMQLDPTANLKRMSKGMKQKTAIVTAFMNSPEILILDEPTTGLDPLMRDAFVNLIKEEKARGATIIMSNHMFDELEHTCDYVAFIKDGHIVDIVDMGTIKHRNYRVYEVEFFNKKDYLAVDKSHVEILASDDIKLSYVFKMDIKKSSGMFKEFSKFNIKSLTEKQYNLEQYFMENVIGGMKDE